MTPYPIESASGQHQLPQRLHRANTQSTSYRSVQANLAAKGTPWRADNEKNRLLVPAAAAADDASGVTQSCLARRVPISDAGDAFAAVNLAKRGVVQREGEGGTYTYRRG